MQASWDAGNQWSEAAGMKEPGKTGWHMQPLWDIWYLDKGETCPLIRLNSCSA